MDESEAMKFISDVDEADLGGRARRLRELNQLLPKDGLMAFNGTVAQLVFEDVKATWIYGYFVATVITSYVFCIQQLAGNLRMLSDVSSDVISSNLDLENLGALAKSHSLVTPELHANLVELHDRAQMYLEVSIDEYVPRAERHFSEVDQHTDGDALLLDARLALTTAVSLLLLRSD